MNPMEKSRRLKKFEKELVTRSLEQQ